MATKNSNTPNGYRDAGTMDLMSRGWTQRLMYDHLPPPVTDGADQCIRVGRMWSGSGKNPYWPWDAIFKAEREIIHSEDPKVRQLSKKMRERVLRSFNMNKLLAALLLVAVQTAAADLLSGRVVGVAGGDTITVLGQDHEKHKIRLSGIDAPEIAQPFGSRSKQSLSDLASETCIPRMQAIYGASNMSLRKSPAARQDIWHFLVRALGTPDRPPNSHV